jgi:hypothetical protein
MTRSAPSSVLLTSMLLLRAPGTWSTALPEPTATRPQRTATLPPYLGAHTDTAKCYPRRRASSS